MVGEIGRKQAGKCRGCLIRTARGECCWLKGTPQGEFHLFGAVELYILRG